MNAGRSACAIRFASVATSSSSGAAPLPVHSSTGGSSPLAAPNTSSGKSRKVGPRCGVIASEAAACTAAAACDGSFTVPADFVIDATTGT
ncbi:unannotated protein [freshwater metagenome]|uniref:Unannotated protein n=1 Tax=freshwater metagenome TaxID=449393 RepID=A0A6J6GPV9_9ZZZZ